MPRSRVRLTLLATACIALGVTGCATTAAHEPAPTTASQATPAASTFVIRHTGVAPTPSAAELQDLTTFAKQMHRPLADVIAEQVGQEQVDVLADSLESDSSSGVVSVWRERAIPPVLHLTFTHTPSASVVAQLRALPLDSEVRTGLPLAHGALVAFSEAACGAVNRVPGVQFISGAPNTAGDGVDIEYANTPGSSPVPEAEILGRIRAATTRWAINGELPVPVHLTAGPLSDLATASTG